MKITKAQRDQIIHERALKIQSDLGSDLYRPEDYYELARRLIEQEEELGLPINPYPLNQEAEGKEGSPDEKVTDLAQHRRARGK